MPTPSEKTQSDTGRRRFDPDDVRMTLGEHLEELRSRMIKLLIGLLLGAIICFVFRDRLMQLLLGPTFAVLRRRELVPELVALDPLEPFMTTLKVSVILGFMLSAPYGLYQIWAFVASGLYQREQRFVRAFVPVSISLFMGGALFFLFIVLPVLLNFLIGFMEVVPSFDPAGNLFGDWLGGAPTVVATAPATTQEAPAASIRVLELDPADPPEGSLWINAKEHELRMRMSNETRVIRTAPLDRPNMIRPNFSMRSTIQMTLQMAAAFGVGFQVPVVVAFLATLGIASAEAMGKSRRVTWFVMAICAAVFTPSGDPGTMLLLLIPMGILFEAGLIAAKSIEKRKAAERAADGW